MRASGVSSRDCGAHCPKGFLDLVPTIAKLVRIERPVVHDTREAYCLTRLRASADVQIKYVGASPSSFKPTKT